jgi:ankyrin repeat protein
LAAKQGHLEMARLLIKYQTNVNHRDLSGRTPLFHAVLAGSVECVALLLANMSSAFLSDNDGNTVEDMIAFDCEN